MLDVVEAQVTLGVAIDQGARVDHLRVKPGVAGDLPMEDAAVAVGPVHHGGNRQAAGWRHNGSSSGDGGSSAHAGGSGRLGAGDEYCRKRAIISQSCLRCMHAAGSVVVSAAMRERQTGKKMLLGLASDFRVRAKACSMKASECTLLMLSPKCEVTTSVTQGECQT